MSLMPDAKFIAVMLLCAFLIDRIIASLMFASSYLEASADKTDKGREKRKELRRTLLYFLLSGTLAAAAMAMFRNMRLNLSALNPGSLVQTIVTWLILVAGTDRVSKFVGLASDAPAPVRKPDSAEIHVAGTLRVDSETAAKIDRAAAS